MALPGSVLPSVAHSALVGRTSPAAAVRVSLVLQPAHAALLARLAAHSSGRPGLSQRVMNGLFRPNPFARAQVAAYMRAHGFRSAGNGMLTMSFTGNAAQAEQAFGVSLNHYRLADGTAYRAPSGAIHLPPALASRVITRRRPLDAAADAAARAAHGAPHGRRREAADLAERLPCGCDRRADAAGSLQPADLAGANGYNSQPLLDIERRRHGRERRAGRVLGLPERRHRRRTRRATALTTPVTRVNVNGGTGHRRGGGDIEVALDQEVAGRRGTGPGPHLHVRRAAVDLDGGRSSTRSTATTRARASTSSRTAGATARSRCSRPTRPPTTASCS